MLSPSPSSVFSHKDHNIILEKQISKYSILTVIELGPPLSESSTTISKFYNPADSEHKLHKTRIENWLSIGFELEFFWLGTYSHNDYIMFNLQYDGAS